MRRRPSTWALLALLIVACQASAPTAASTDASSDASSEASTDASRACSIEIVGGGAYVDHATPSPDGAGWCCPTGVPSCGCGYFGGFVHSRCSCGEYFPSDPTDVRRDAPCDLAPTDWILGTDAHGCVAYTERPTPTACCNCPADAGVSDAAAETDAR